jgi:hypothetical protein
VHDRTVSVSCHPHERSSSAAGARSLDYRGVQIRTTTTEKVEALFAELKSHSHIGLHRLRLRRLKFVREQFFLAGNLTAAHRRIETEARTQRRIQKLSALCSGSFGEGRVHRATKQRGSCRQFLNALHSCPAEELAESFEADRIWSPSVRLGSFIFHDQKAICHRPKPFQEYLLLLNEVQRVCHKNSVDRRKTEAGAL